MWRRASVPVVLLICAAGCVRREGRNADCRWPGEPKTRAFDLNDARTLSAEAEFAEDLAIRYADAHDGVRSGNFESMRVYGESRDRCAARMFAAIAEARGVPVSQVAATLGKNRGRIDFAVNLPFFCIYGFASLWIVRRIWTRYPPHDGWIAGLVMILFCSLVFGIGGAMLGEQWSTAVESIRVGTGHLSDRVALLPWVRYRGALFAAVVFMFLGIAAVTGWRKHQRG